MVGLVVEGDTDVAIATRLLAVAGVGVDTGRIVVCGGKTALDSRVPKYRNAARHAGWFVLRDCDQDAGGCPVALVHRLLPDGPTPGLCLRVAVREAEAWLMADSEVFADFFAVPVGRVPSSPDDEADAKHALVDACGRSRRRHIREGMLPRPGSGRAVGRDYRPLIEEYCEVWRPRIAAGSSPSLARALLALDLMVTDGRW